MTINSGNKILDATIASLQKKLKREDMFSMGPGFEKADALPTGSTALDMGIGIGGIPMGRVVEIYGPESSGKTSLSLRIMKSWYDHREALGQAHRRAVFVDAEHVTSGDMIESMGIPMDELIWVKPESTEEALNTIADLVKTEQVGIIILDSVDALQNESQLKKNIGEDDMGGIGKYMGKHLRELSKVAMTTNTLMIYINQIRYNMDKYNGEGQWVTPGGKALKFYAALRMQLMKGQESKVPNSFLMRVKIIKNKVSPPRKDPVEIDFEYAVGPNPYTDLINAAKDLQVLRFAGQGTRVRYTPDAEEEVLASTGGGSGAAEALEADESLYLRLRRATLIAGGVHVADSAGEDTSSEQEATTEG